MEYSHNIYLYSGSCQQQRNNARDQLKQQPQQEKDDNAQGPCRAVGLLALDTSRHEVPAVPTVMGNETRLDITRDCSFNLSRLRRVL